MPFRGRLSGHAENMHRAGADFHDEQHVESAQRDGVEGEEVGGKQRGGLRNPSVRDKGNVVVAESECGEVGVLVGGTSPRWVATAKEGGEE